MTRKETIIYVLALERTISSDIPQHLNERLIKFGSRDTHAISIHLASNEYEGFLIRFEGVSS